VERCSDGVVVCAHNWINETPGMRNPSFQSRHRLLQITNSCGCQGRYHCRGEEGDSLTSQKTGLQCYNETLVSGDTC
jgi:hypothetical protein